MATERTMVTRWKSVVDPSVKKAADEVGDNSEAASRKSTAAWTAVGSAIGNLAAEGLTRVADSAVEFAQDSLRAASDLKESVNVTGLTFGKYAPKMESFFKGAATSVGMSETAAREAASSVGGLLQNMGLGRQETVDWSEKLLALSADMGSAFNSDPVDAMEAIGAGLRGEAEPLRRYNVMLSDAALKQEAQTLGLYKGKGALDNTAKAQAALSLITKQTSKVQGDFQNTADGAANAARIQAAKVEDLKAKFADALLPAQEAVYGFMNDKLLPGLEGMTDGMKTGIDWIQKNSGTLTALGVVVGVLSAGYLALAAAQAASSAAAAVQAAGGILGFLKAWAAQQAILNVIMSANPIALVVIAIAALVAGIVVAYQKSEVFRNAVDTAFKAIAAAGRWLWNNALKPVIQFIVNGFAWVVDGIADFLAALGQVPGFGWAKTASDGLRGIADQARSAADNLKEIPAEKSTTVTLSATTSGEDRIAELQSKIDGLQGKLVEAKANGDASEVAKVQTEIDKLKGKKVEIEAELKKGTVGKIKVVPGKSAGAMIAVAVANGAIFGGIAARARRFANGGVENHTAQIAPAGAWRVWAEDETGGESYIPLAASKRSRSVPIWWETGRRLGVINNADGGLYGRQSAASTDGLADALLQLIARMLTRDDLQSLIDALRQAPTGPRPVARLG